MDSQTLQRVKDLLFQNDAVGIFVGQDPILDTMAAALSLYLSLSKTSKKISIASPTSPIVELSSLVGIDKVKNNLDGANGDLTVSFPYREGEIEKVSYTLEDGFLNIIVKAGDDGISFSEKEIIYKRGGGFPKLIFVIGTPRLSDLGRLFDAAGLKDTTIINIDNKQENQGFGDVVLVSPSFSSVSEQMATFLSSLNFDIDVDIAQNLLSGILQATDNFQNSKTSPLAFEMAGLLMKKGARRILPSTVSYPSDSGSFFTPPSQTFRTQQQTKTNIEEVELEKKSDIKDEEKEKKETPPDWLAPKIYKGSTLV